MAKQEAAQTILNAANTQDAKKASIYKARKGYKIVQVPVIPGVAVTVDEDKDEHLLGTGFFWSEEGELILCYALEIPAEQATPLNRDFENRKAAHRRAHRCKIWNAKHTKKIMCPFSNSCGKCPYTEEERLPSEAEEHQEVSFDVVNEDKLHTSPDSFGSAENMELGVQMKEMMDKLKSLEDQTLYTLGTLLNLQYEVEEIQNRLNLDDESMREYSVEYIMYYHKYIG